MLKIHSGAFILLKVLLCIGLISAYAEGMDVSAQQVHSKTYMKPSEDKIMKILTQLQYRVTQENGTERAFNNEYWKNKKPGIYVDIVSGEPLFSSTDKFVSGTGWPSFTRPLEPDNIVEKEDKGIFMTRIEVRSRHGDSHLGHVFPDGPEPTGLRYCINSASLRFIPIQKLKEEGYGDYLMLFKKSNKVDNVQHENMSEDMRDKKEGM